MTEKKNFWQTVPGVITGLAAILTAIVGLIPILTSGNNDNPQPDQSASPTPGSSSANAGSSSSNSTGAAPRAVVAPRSLDFGRLGSGRTAQETVTVANSGGEYLVIDSATIEGRSDTFSVEAQECLDETTGIAPGDECEITVSFAPTSPGASAGVLEIEHSGPDSPSRLALNGEGVLLDL